MKTDLFRKSIVIGVMLLFVGAGVVSNISENVSAKYIIIIFVDDDNTEGPWDGSQGYPYQYIQDGIDNAASGNTVYVYSGTYIENIVVDEEIILVGQDRQDTIIDGDFVDNTVVISASSVLFSGFSVINGVENGIQVEGEDVNISDCIVRDNKYGIILYYTAGINISNCVIHNNEYYSIDIIGTSQVDITRCTSYGNGDAGELKPGEIHLTGESGTSENIVISYCSITGNYGGIWVGHHSSDIEVHHNTIYGNPDYGIVVSGYFLSDVFIHNNVIQGNGAENHFGGIHIQHCFEDDNILVQHNTIQSNNIWGIFVTDSTDVEILKNNFIDNEISASFYYATGQSNTWDGNYWNRPRVLPYAIFGLTGGPEEQTPWVEFDWHPAWDPYDI